MTRWSRRPAGDDDALAERPGASAPIVVFGSVPGGRAVGLEPAAANVSLSFKCRTSF
ncbi:protein of unknown function [Methylocella tundrae]|uniref:Uncharacterized protein n=1 Tax=Methylocella tundrae TaxID=227605 RepID=A0A4U8Z2C2_METTU|nr:protein of unknown function [Methylocella tundrae]